MTMIDNSAGGAKDCKNGVEDLDLIIDRSVVAGKLSELRTGFLASEKIFPHSTKDQLCITGALVHGLLFLV